MAVIMGTEMEQINQIKDLLKPALEDLERCKIFAANEFALASKVGEFHTECNARFAKLEQYLNQAFEDLARKQVNNPGNRRDIAESKVLQTLPVFDGTLRWREWVTKLVTVMEQLRPGSRFILEFVMKQETEDWMKESHDLWFAHVDWAK